MPWQSHWLSLRIDSSDRPITRCVSLNTRVSDDWLIDILEKSGFTTRKEQVFMAIEL